MENELNEIIKKLNFIIENEEKLSQRITKIEKVMSVIENELFLTPDEFEIQCPYCNAEFVENFEFGMKHEVKCPECGNSIELDWYEDEDGCCSCGHDECDGECECDECGHCEDEEDNNEDDM